MSDERGNAVRSLALVPRVALAHLEVRMPLRLVEMKERLMAVPLVNIRSICRILHQMSPILLPLRDRRLSMV